MTPVLTEKCEQTVQSIAFTVSHYESQESLMARQRLARGRLRRRSTADGLLAKQARAQAALFRVVSLVEAHTADEIVARLADEFPTPRSAIRSDAYLASEDSAIRAWGEMKDRLTKWFGLVIAGCDAWPHLMSLTEVRNAVAHGSGELTRKQQRGDIAAFAVRFSHLDVTLDGHRLVLGSQAVDKSRDIAVSYLEWLDSGLNAFDNASVP